MGSRLSGKSIFALTSSNLSANYYYLKSLYNCPNGLTMDNILHPSLDDKKNVYSYLNSTFSQYLSKNFNQIDMDRDGIISDSDVTQYNTQLYATGLTYDQLAQMCASGASNSLLETVLSNFSEIDKNGDGRITSAEISAYGVEQEAEEIKDKYPKVDMDKISIFHTPSASSSSKTEKES